MAEGARRIITHYNNNTIISCDERILYVYALIDLLYFCGQQLQCVIGPEFIGPIVVERKLHISRTDHFVRSDPVRLASTKLAFCIRHHAYKSIIARFRTGTLMRSLKIRRRKVYTVHVSPTVPTHFQVRYIYSIAARPLSQGRSGLDIIIRSLRIAIIM